MRLSISPIVERVHMSVHAGELLIKEKVEAGRLVSAAAPIAGASPLALLARHTAEPRLYWRSASLAPVYAGVGIAAQLTASGRARFDSIRDQLGALFSQAVLPAGVPAWARPRVFGGFSYEAGFASPGIWSAFPPALFILPRYQLSHLDGQTWLTVNMLFDEATAPRAQELLSASLDRLAAEALAPDAAPMPAPTGLAVDYPTGSQDWASMVEEAVARIRRGELEKVVLARAAEAHAPGRIDPVRALAALDERYPDCYRFLVEPSPGRAFFGATPELLATVEGGQVATGALAGSISRGATPEQDAALGRSLLDSAKNQHEHAVVVRDIAARLSPITTGLSVAGRPALRKLQNIQHLHTSISARLADGVDALHLVEALHPTPALGGAPRELAARAIAELEPQPRGWYGAPVGWLDAEGNSQFAVAIRSAVSSGGDARLYSGAGIVADSVPESEWQETEWKFRPLLDALSSGDTE